jgi:hypothetical protein
MHRLPAVVAILELQHVLEHDLGGQSDVCLGLVTEGFRL